MEVGGEELGSVEKEERRGGKKRDGRLYSTSASVLCGNFLHYR